MAETASHLLSIARIIAPTDIEVRERDGFSYRPLIDGFDMLGFSLNLVDVHGRHYKTKVAGATRTYFVKSGEGTFTLDGEEHQVRESDSYVIPPGHVYEYQGQMTLLELNVPGTTRENETNLDKPQ